MELSLSLSLVPHKKQVLLRWQESKVNPNDHVATETSDKTKLPHVEEDYVDVQSKELLQVPTTGGCGYLNT